MKKKLIFLCILIFIVYILFLPQDAVTAAANGLVLWYERVLPSLLPFAILSNILIYSNFTGYLVKLLYPLLHLILPTSRNGSFVLLSGFLFGFPMGSKNCAEMWKCGQLEYWESEILFMVTNNISPVFISGYILCQELHMPSLIPLSYLVLFLPPIITGKILFYLQKSKKRNFAGNGVSDSPGNTNAGTYKKPASGSQINFKIIDAGIMNGFETLTRLGGYIMLFSMISSMLRLIPLPENIKLILTGFTEITNGIKAVSQSSLTPACRYSLAMAFTAFGGFSGLAQTSSMIKGTGLSIKKYGIFKLVMTVLTAVLAWTAVNLVYLSAVPPVDLP